MPLRVTLAKILGAEAISVKAGERELMRAGKEGKLPISMKLQDIDLSARIRDKKEYKKRLIRAQLQMLMIQRHLYLNRREAILVFEGWDAAGKGGAIRRLVEKLDPRGFVVHPIAAPTPDEKDVHYLQRFWTRLPGPGRLGIFDRSWYGRVLVERVEGFASPPDWKRAYEEINAFEKLLVGDGVPILKFFLHISKDEQLKRFHEREQDPFKSWKITPEDYRNREKWDSYARAIEDMLERTSTRHAPWYPLAGEHKWHARVEVCEQAARGLGRRLNCPLKLPKGWRESEE